VFDPFTLSILNRHRFFPCTHHVDRMAPIGVEVPRTSVNDTTIIKKSYSIVCPFETSLDVGACNHEVEEVAQDHVAFSLWYIQNIASRGWIHVYRFPPSYRVNTDDRVDSVSLRTALVVMEGLDLAHT